MKKKILSLALVLAMALTLMPTMAFAASHDASGACSGATYTATEAKDATCTEAGYAAYCVCSVCSNYFAGTDGSGTEIGDATDLATWKAEGGDGYVPPNGHTAVHHVATDSSCTSQGVNEHWTCSVCNKFFSDAACETETTESAVKKPLAAHTLGDLVEEVPATCSKAGTKAHYTCSVCEKNFSDAQGKTELSDLVIAKLAHTDTTPQDGVCDVCGKNTSCTGKADCTADTHTANKCISQCTGAASCPNNEGFHKANCVSLCTGGDDCPNTAGNAAYHKDGCPKKDAPASTVAISSASSDGRQMTVNVSITPAPQADVDFTVSIDTDVASVTQDQKAELNPVVSCTTGTPEGSEVQASGSGTAYSVTFGLPFTLPDGDYKVWVNDDSVHAFTCTVSTAAKPSVPGTSAGQLPSAGSVTDASSAETAIKNVQAMDAKELQKDLEKGGSVAEDFAKLDAAVQTSGGIDVEVRSDSEAPSFLRGSSVSIVGAALNASATNSTVRLSISSPARQRTFSSKYSNSVASQFSMTLSGVKDASSLAVPVLITLPLPSSVSARRVVVLHYHSGSSTPTVITPKVADGYISFTLTGFSDFVVTETVSTSSGGSSGGGGRPSSGGGTVIVTPPGTTTTTPDGVFTDVPASHWAAAQITWARDNGVMNGTGNGAFSPDRQVNRQQLWMVLARLANAAPANMAAAREWAINTGVSDGANGEGTMSRQQLVTMLYRYAQSQEMTLEGAADLGTYPDSAAVASYAQEALAWAVGNGIVTGTSDGRLNPEGTATRAQFAVILYRFSHQG